MSYFWYPDFLKPFLHQIRAKVPANWLESPTRKGGGWRWSNRENPRENPNDTIRIDPGRAEVSMPSQQVDHVVVNTNSVIIGRNGDPMPQF